MRWYIFAGTLHTGQWYVLAESADHAWATDMALTRSPSWSFPKRKPTGSPRALAAMARARGRIASR
jgi:hypothetical protein